MQQQIQSADRFLIRGINQSILLNLIRAHGPISRPQLAMLSGLSQVTVIKITSTLMDHHLILEKDYAESTGARRAGLLEINPDGGFAVGLIPQQDSLTAVILNLNGDLVHSQQWNVSLRDNYPRAIDLFVQCIEELFSNSGIAREKIIGVGLGMSGLMDAERGHCLASSMMNWRNVEISRPLENRMGIPVFLDNDVNCLAVYEKLFGQAHQRAGILLGASLANLVNVFNPECVVLSGPNIDASTLASDLLLEPMRQAFKEHLYSQIGKDLHFIVEKLGFESWARGAGSLVLRHLFASPAHVHAERTLGPT